MYSNLKHNFSTYISYLKELDEQSKRFLLYMLAFAPCVFGAEYLFLNGMQNFLTVLGVIGGDVSTKSGALSNLNLFELLLVVFLAAALKFLFLGLKDFFSGISGQSYSRFWRKKVLGVAYFSRSLPPHHFLISNFTDESSKVTNVFHSSINLFSSLLLSLFFGLAALKTAPKEFGFCLLLGCCFLPLLKFVKSNFDGMSLTVTWNKISKELITGMLNNFTIRLYGRQKTENKSSSKLLDQYFDFYSDYFRKYIIKVNSIPFLITCSGVFTLYISTIYFKSATIDTLSFFYLFMKLGQSFGEFTGHISNFKIYYPSYLSLKAFVDKQMFFDDSTKKKVDHISSITMKDVSFQYGNNDKWVIKDFNCELVRGDFLFVGGPSGQGKTTVIKLILGQLKPSNGNVHYNANLSSQDWSLSEVVGYVGPESFIVEGSIIENLLYGNDKVIPELQIWKVLDLVSLKEIIEALPGRFNEVLSGSKLLSTGQLQRLCIARMLLRDPQLIVLDEATSNLDNSVEILILERILKYFGDRIIITISHRENASKFSTKNIILSQNVN